MKNLIALISLITLLPYSYSQSAYSGGDGDGYAQTSVNVGQTSLVGKEVWPTVSIFPIPAFTDEVIRLEGLPVSEIPYQIEILNLLGQRLRQYLLQPGQTELVIEPGNLPTGRYVLHVKREDQLGAFQIILTGRP